jgi:hypothetical protein
MLISSYDIQETDEKFDEFCYIVQTTLDQRKFPVQLISSASDWKDKNGKVIAQHPADLIDKIMSFQGEFVELHKIGNSFHLVTSSYDHPRGFIIYIRSTR